MGSKRAVNLLRRLGGEFRVENASLRLDQQVVKVTATTTLLAKDSGKLHIIGPLNAGLAADTIVTLPTAENGLVYEFHFVGGAADAQDFQLNTGADANFYIGGIFQHDIGNEDGAAYHPNLSSNSRINFLTPDAGTWAKVLCDGTNWFINAWLSSATNTGITFADQ
tara:strand:+ start:23894 stop:24391 length:498 start_codon:yes stop_codon:yes gene_type:complete